MTPKNLKEYYASKGLPLPSVKDRAAEYSKLTGKTDAYTGSYDQNVEFLGALTKAPSSTPPPPPAPTSASGGAVLPMTSPSTPVISSSSIRGAIAERGGDPNTAAFGSESAFKRFQDQVKPKTASPARPSYVSEFTKLQEDKGIADLETKIQGLDDEDALLDAELRKFSASEREGQSAAFAVGRMSEAERNVRERKDFITRERNSITNRLNSANKTIETIMGLMDKDYKTARDEYEFEFGKNMQVYSAFQGEIDKDQAAARSNLQIIYNNLKEVGGADKLPATTQAAIAKMEMEAGLPSGFYLSVKKELPDSKIISTTTRDKNGSKFVDLVYQEPDGTIRTASVPFGGGSSSDPDNDDDTGGDKPTWEEYLKAAEAELGMNLIPEGELYKGVRAQYDANYGSAAASKPAAKSSSGGRSI